MHIQWKGKLQSHPGIRFIHSLSIVPLYHPEWCTLISWSTKIQKPHLRFNWTPTGLGWFSKMIAHNFNQCENDHLISAEHLQSLRPLLILHALGVSFLWNLMSLTTLNYNSSALMVCLRNRGDLAPLSQNNGTALKKGADIRGQMRTCLFWLCPSSSALPLHCFPFSFPTRGKPTKKSMIALVQHYLASRRSSYPSTSFY